MKKQTENRKEIKLMMTTEDIRKMAAQCTLVHGQNKGAESL